jgi:RNA polymerase sigma factor (sigma-70 family)
MQPLEETPDRIKKILNGCRKQHRESQKMLYEEYYGYGMSICLRYSENRDEAAAILNDGFMKIFTNIRQFDLSRPLKPWLRKIMINTAIDHYNQNNDQLNLPRWKRLTRNLKTKI